MKKIKGCVNLNIYEEDTWRVVFVDWSQAFPGNCIISCDKKSLSELTDNDWITLGKLEKELERVTKKLFDATMYNFACLMNNAYRDKEKPHVHFHFIPRYEGKRNILNKEYTDRHFGYNMWKWDLNRFKCQKDIYTKEERKEIYELMKKEWNL